MGYYLRPPEGMILNPLKKGKAKNLPCLCGSGKKVKRCCGQFDYMKKDLAETCKKFVNDGASLSQEERRLLAHKIQAEKAAYYQRQKQEEENAKSKSEH
jgi:septal ring factor EnvC (AmiA/AmiB activator)